MINYLQDVSLNYPIGMLPEIITYNNKAIKDEFGWIFDSSLNRLTKSVYAPTGSVKAHLGEFVNISTEYLTVKSTKSLEKVINNTVAAAGLTADNITYADSSTVKDELDDLLSRVETLEALHVDAGEDGGEQQTEPVSSPAVYGAGIASQTANSAEPVQYQRNVLYMTEVQLKRRGITGTHLADVKSGNLYAYYAASPIISVKAGVDAVIEKGYVGEVVTLKPASGAFSVILNRNTNECVKIGDDLLNRLQLVCVETCGDDCVWDIENYAVRRENQIELYSK